MTPSLLPQQALVDDGDAAPDIPVCDHYCGTEPRMRKALALQAELGPVFDITLDCEDGAPVGAEAAHAQLCAELALSADNRFGRVGVRVHPVDHASFEADLDTLIGRAGDRLAFVMVPKPRHLADAQQAMALIEQTARRHGRGQALPVHMLVETHGALRDVQAIAQLPRIQSLSFGLMDFVSAHRGAIPHTAMGVQGQFTHPLVVRAKLEIAAACHAAAKVPSHCVVTEFKDAQALAAAATRAAREFGYTRMWSIHPDQIRVIVDAFSPSTAEVDQALEILLAAQAAQWAPIRHRHAGQDQLHDRASYRYFWQVLLRARRTGQPLPAEAALALFGQAA
ncbi:HpcH/HpaI aldolase/citrate lyase family protein [Aquabacterium sp. OR-4]|uniref:HpcH/HpaI aldolase/citrate lyase family protein n=1 Tax=Aquabacterium sp. OR-4 TaxID=2978127 RepID=UPI0028C5DDB3|nr:aldolase/citrate lyase family protein [Aquabacterium sp. OR-4]MDT7835631.1 aldolase/citrate lyase family protein [Aquabacterium sp. OR-4]